MKQSPAARMGLGGAQFGMPYGVTGDGRQPGAEVVQRTLACAREAGVRFLDTAPAYGDSEEAIGRTGLAPAFRIVSKTPKGLAALPIDALTARVRRSVAQSLAALRVSQLDTILVHDAADLLGATGAALWTALERVRADGLCERIGVSVYHSEEIDLIISRFPIQLVQLPYNVLDRRLVHGGQFERLADAGVAIHVRSIFLQGLLLARPDTIPENLAPIGRAVGELREWAGSRGHTVVQAIIADVLRHKGVECCLFGVHSVDELHTILQAAETALSDTRPAPFEAETILGDQFLDPSRWGELG